MRAGTLRFRELMFDVNPLQRLGQRGAHRARAPMRSNLGAGVGLGLLARLGLAEQPELSVRRLLRRCSKAPSQQQPHLLLQLLDPSSASRSTILADGARGAHPHGAAPERVVTYETLLRRVWADRGNGDTKVVRTFVKQLRGKLSDPSAKPSWIFNVRGVGYRMPRPGEPDRT